MSKDVRNKDALDAAAAEEEAAADEMMVVVVVSDEPTDSDDRGGVPRRDSPRSLAALLLQILSRSRAKPTLRKRTTFLPQFEFDGKRAS